VSYLTIDIDKDPVTGKVTVVTYLDKQYWDEPCICEDPDNEEADVHDVIRTTHIVDGVRIRADNENHRFYLLGGVPHEQHSETETNAEERIN
jgi:hypothetical protein